MTDLPMLASPSTGSSGRRVINLSTLLERGWVQDLKLDGVRSFGRYGRLVNRLGTDITSRYPEISVPADHWLDGEIVALDGSFETTLMRDQQSRPAAIKRLAESHPCRFIAFDFLDFERDTSLGYTDRRYHLERLEGIDTTTVSREPDFFDRVASLGMEGVIAKRPESRYQFGRRSVDWVKFKVLHRVSCIVTGYTAGQGQREHFGAMEIAMVRAGKPVSVGRVGSGFTERDTHVLKRRIDAGEHLVIEVECVNRTSGDQLRFPVYKGVRSDIALHACTTDQLDALPTC